MATRFLETYGSAAGDAATELTRLKGDSAVVSPILIDAVDGVLKYYDRLNSVVQQVLGTVVPPISATANLSLTSALHAGRTVVVNKADGITITLPAASGSGAKFKIIVGTTLTSNSLVVAVANANDYFRGFALLANDTDGSASNFETANTGTVATESDTITLNRTTTGVGTIGDFIEIEDFKANIWSVRICAQATGIEATPFSVAV